jgi:hypothetical protein
MPYEFSFCRVFAEKRKKFKKLREKVFFFCASCSLSKFMALEGASLLLSKKVCFATPAREEEKKTNENRRKKKML